MTRAGEFRDIWTKAYDAAGAEVAPEAADAAKTVLYAPHGGVRPAKNFLVADSDYVEVLTEIDIQSPIPAAVKHRRTRAASSSSAVGSTTDVAHLRAPDPQAFEGAALRGWSIASA